MKRTLRLVGVAAMVLLLAASCKKDEKNNGETQRMTFTAGIEQGNSKTGLTPNGSHAFNQVWSEGDAIKVNGTTFGLKNGAYTDCAEFDGEVIPAETYYAVYPATAALSNSTATFTLPASQDYVAGSYQSNLAPMAAKSTDENLSFTNLCGLMELGLKGENITVTSLELSCDKPICGQTSAYTIGGDAALAMPTDALGKTVTMNCVTTACPNGVALNGTTPTSFIFVLPPVTEGDFTLTVTYSGGTQTITLPENISIGAGKVAYNTNPYLIEQETPTTDASATLNTNDVRIGPKGFWVSGTISGVSKGSAEVGVCYSQTNSNPKYADGHSTISTSASTFSVDVNGLNSDKPYYYRSYIKYNGGEAYGTSVYTLTTESATSTTGTGTVSDKYYFSVSSGKQVVFSKGNLQYNAGLNEWRFAEHQYDVVSNTNNTDPHANYPVWIDLFGYGTSGYNNGQTCYQPWSGSSSGTDYYQNNLTGTADWGYNPIVNGGGEPNTWYTLSLEECQYLLGVFSSPKRNNAENLRGLAMVGDRPGVVILPDKWEKPEGIGFTPTHGGAAFTSNVYTISDWEKMEQNGAVFLPVSAMRLRGGQFYNWDSDGQWGQMYWLGTHQSSTHSKRIMLHIDLGGGRIDESFGLGNGDGNAKNYAVPVRLVKTYENVY